MKYLLNTLGWIFAKLPESFMGALCACIGWIIYAFPSRRVLVAFSNVHHCFPKMGRSQRNKIVYESCARMVEMALFVLASPHMSKERLRSHIKISDYILKELSKKVENPTPTVLLIPHYAMMETITMLPLVSDVPLPKTGVYYRPFNNKGLEDWIKESRQRCGLELVSRKGGLMHGVDFLRKNGCLAMLFDQNVVNSGSTLLFFNQLCSSSELGGIFVERFKCDVGILYARRTGFWRSEIDGKYLDAKTVEDVTCASNEWLEDDLKNNITACYDWLWLHRRWRLNANSYYALRTITHKSMIENSLKRRGLSEIPRGSRIFVTAPDSLIDAISLLPLLRALRVSRKDAAVTLICDYKQTKILDAIGRGQAYDDIISAPSRSDGWIARISFFRKLLHYYPDIHLNFVDSLQSDLEGFSMAAPVRLAIEKNRKRIFSFMNFRPDAATESEHISVEYDAFMKHFGMNVSPDYSPFENRNFIPAENDIVRVGIVCTDTEESDWESEKWAQLLKILDDKLPNVKFTVYGDDAKKAFEISKKLDEADVEFSQANGDADILKGVSSSDVVIGVNSPILHFANAVGVKTVAICGMSNPLRHGLVFDAPKAELQPPNCPHQGGMDVNLVEPQAVADAVVKLFLKI